MVNEHDHRGLPAVIRSAAYSALGLSVVGGLVAVLGAPVKWAAIFGIIGG